MQTLLTIIHVVVSILLCLLILVQSGKGGGMGAAFGGASAQIFGGRGAGNFLSKLTSVAAVVFFLTSITLSVLSSRQHSVVIEKAKAAAAAVAEPSGDKADATAEPIPVPEAASPTEEPAP